jgi:bifunctional non-homologous end joining protein LigD
MAFQRKMKPAIGVKAPFPGFIDPALAPLIDKAPKGERWNPRDQVRRLTASNSTSPTRTPRCSPAPESTGPALQENRRRCVPDQRRPGHPRRRSAGAGRRRHQAFSVLQNELKGRSTKSVMVPFDLLYLNGYYLRKLPLEERKSHLKKLIAKTAIQFSEGFEVDGREMYKHACSVGLEGVVSKVRDSRRLCAEGQ